jgi:hypothetical protein
MAAADVHAVAVEANFSQGSGTPPASRKRSHSLVMEMGRCYAQGVNDALRARATNLEIFRLSRTSGTGLFRRSGILKFRRASGGELVEIVSPYMA